MSPTTPLWSLSKTRSIQIGRTLDTTLQVNLCQKLLFLYELTHNMTTDWIHWITNSIHENSKLKPKENMLCTEIVSDIQNNFCTQHVLPMFFKKKSFWQRFACTEQNHMKQCVMEIPFRTKVSYHYIICYLACSFTF